MAELKTLLFFVIVLNLHCEKPCATYTSRPLTGAMEDYFGVYKNKNWWVYQNRPGTKRDSIFLQDFAETFLSNKTTCEKNQRRIFAIDGSYLADGNKFFCDYFTGGHITIIRWTPYLPEFRHSSLDQKITVFPAENNTNSPFLDSVRINGATYYNIQVGKESTATYFFAKNTGLVGWMNVLDTFNLVSFKIF
jgi:hypothetical protein